MKTEIVHIVKNDILYIIGHCFTKRHSVWKQAERIYYWCLLHIMIGNVTNVSYVLWKHHMNLLLQIFQS